MPHPSPARGLVRLQKAVGAARAEEHDQVGATGGDVFGGIAEASILPVDHPGEPTSAPEQVARPVVAVHQAGPVRGGRDGRPRSQRRLAQCGLERIVGHRVRGKSLRYQLRLTGQERQATGWHPMHTCQRAGCFADIPVVIRRVEQGPARQAGRHDRRDAQKPARAVGEQRPWGG